MFSVVHIYSDRLIFKSPATATILSNECDPAIRKRSISPSSPKPAAAATISITTIPIDDIQPRRPAPAIKFKSKLPRESENCRRVSNGSRPSHQTHSEASHRKRFENVAHSAHEPKAIALQPGLRQARGTANRQRHPVAHQNRR